jgi:ornithine cyclodeaminase
MKDKVNIELVAGTSPEDTIKGSDVIATATMARAPYVNQEWWKEGVCHIETSFWDTPPEALAHVDRIVTDSWFQVKHHGADVAWRAVRDGFIGEDKIYGDLGEIVVGDKAGRADRKQKILFNCIGMGIHDLSEGFRVYENAKAAGIGRTLPLWDEPILFG